MLRTIIKEQLINEYTSETAIGYHASGELIDKFSYDYVARVGAIDAKGSGFYFFADYPPVDMKWNRYQHKCRLNLQHMPSVEHPVTQETIQDVAKLIMANEYWEVDYANYMGEELDEKNMDNALMLAEVLVEDDENEYEAFLTVANVVYNNMGKQWAINMHRVLGFDGVRIERDVHDHFVVWNPDAIEVLEIIDNNTGEVVKKMN